MTLLEGVHSPTDINQCSYCGTQCKPESFPGEDEGIREIFITTSLVWSPILEKMKVDRAFALHFPDWRWGDRHCPIAVGIYCIVGQHIELGFAACSDFCVAALYVAIREQIDEVHDITPVFLSELAEFEREEWENAATGGNHDP